MGRVKDHRSERLACSSGRMCMVCAAGLWCNSSRCATRSQASADGMLPSVPQCTLAASGNVTGVAGCSASSAPLSTSGSCAAASVSGLLSTAASCCVLRTVRDLAASFRCRVPGLAAGDVSACRGRAGLIGCCVVCRALFAGCSCRPGAWALRVAGGLVATSWFAGSASASLADGCSEALCVS